MKVAKVASDILGNLGNLRIDLHHVMNTKRRLIPLSSVKQESVKWLWRDRIPLGEITLLDGDPGQSKSTLTYDLAARVTTGTPMPFSTDTAAPAGVVLIQAEDCLGGKVKPTLVAAGADMKRVQVYDRKRFQEEPLVLPDDLPLIAMAAAAVKAKLVVIDPLSEFLGANLNSDASVRKALRPLANFAAKAKLAVLIARHLTKHGSSNPLYRGLGSIAVIGLARTAFWLTSDPDSDDPYRHLLAQTKNNLSAAVSLSYRTIKTGEAVLIQWLGESDYTAGDVSGTDAESRSKLEEAKEVLLGILEDGPLHSKEVFRLAREAGVAMRTLNRGKRALKVKSLKKGGGCTVRWHWALPQHVPPQHSGGHQGEAPSGSGAAVPAQG